MRTLQISVDCDAIEIIESHRCFDLDQDNNRINKDDLCIVIRFPDQSEIALSPHDQIRFTDTGLVIVTPEIIDTPIDTTK